jgi:hypothetical protein
MSVPSPNVVIAVAWAAVSAGACHPGNSSPDAAVAPPATGLSELRPRYEAINGTVEFVEHDGRPAVHLVAPPEKRSTDMHLLAIVPDSHFAEGSLRVDVAGAPFDSTSDARGFIGLAFHVASSGSRFECLYLRPTNGRADDQLRRNHATQYVSYPDFPWEKLRQSSPGVYESYADIQAGVWTTLRVVVKGKTATLYIDEADQPALIVSDLKLGETSGQVALWSHATTDGYFSRLEVSAR